jgi:hypothetical protein
MKGRSLAFIIPLLLCLPATGSLKKLTKTHVVAAPAVTRSEAEVMWRNPTDIRSRNLFYGPGGKKDEPHGRVTFVEEDLDGTNPKFEVKDQDGVKWKVKLGFEARPETAASRLVWAAGYFAHEDYFVPELHVDHLPAHLHRGQKLVGPNGTVYNVRMKRDPKGEKKISNWQWRENSFTGTRELNGLRVMMALINNWDLTDQNTAIYETKSAEKPERIYMVSDLGASFGTPRLTWPLKRTRGNLAMYRHSKFIADETPGYVDFTDPQHASGYVLFRPREYRLRLHLQWIGKHIPRSDAKWIGGVLGQLSHEQIRDAFRAAGYSNEEVAEFAAVVEGRIAELRAL